MIVVLGTSVIVSALLSPSGPPAKIIQRWELQELDVAVTAALISEMERVLGYSRIASRLHWSTEEISSFGRWFAMAAILVEPKNTLDVVKEDPTANRVLECAAAANAAYLITGDSHLLEVKEYQGINVLSPAGFLAYLNS